MWTDQTVADLKRLWYHGWTARRIAVKLHAKSRNAVIGKLSRLGLIGKPNRPRVVAKPKPKPKPKPASKPAPMLAPVPMVPEPEAQPEEAKRDPWLGAPRAVFNLRAASCRWPIGDPRAPDFRFCDGKAQKHAYCADHFMIAVQPSRPRQR